MKNQYFGDVRDLFKYDLIEYLCTNIPTKLHLHFIALLTEDDNTNEGMHVTYSKAKAGFKNNELVSFLFQMRQNDRRLIAIKKYFDNKNISNHVEDTYFSNKVREKYFCSVLSRVKENSILFFDPDNGLEVKHYTEKHIRYDEIKRFYESIDNESIIMTYQHFPRVNRLNYIDQRVEEMSKYFNDRLLYISDNSIVFFFLSKSETQFENIKKILFDYNLNYPRLVSSLSDQFNKNDQKTFF